MRRIVLALVPLLVLFGGCSRKFNLTTPVTIVAFGDSLTAGYGLPPEESYPAVLTTRLQEIGIPATVENFGVSGDTTADALARTKEAVETRPDIVVIVIGANDHFRNVDADTVESNLRAIVQRFQSAGARTVIGAVKFPGFYKIQSGNPGYDDIYARVAEETDSILIEDFLDGVSGDRDLNLPDRIHPTAEGYRIIVDRSVVPGIERAIRRR